MDRKEKLLDLLIRQNGLLKRKKENEDEVGKWRAERVAEFTAQNPWRPIVRFSGGRQTAIPPVPSESLRGNSWDRYLVCRTQIPLTLGWALSIHKSQGMTLQHVELSTKDIFETGQLYVGLSRATTLGGLTVTGLNRKVLEMDPDVLAFYEGVDRWVDLGRTNKPVSRLGPVGKIDPAEGQMSAVKGSARIAGTSMPFTSSQVPEGRNNMVSTRSSNTSTPPMSSQNRDWRTNPASTRTASTSMPFASSQMGKGTIPKSTSASSLSSVSGSITSKVEVIDLTQD